MEKSLQAQSGLESNAKQNSITTEANDQIPETSLKAETKTEQTLKPDETSAKEQVFNVTKKDGMDPNVTEKRSDAEALHKLQNQERSTATGFNSNLKNERKTSLTSELVKKFNPEPKNTFMTEKGLEMERKLQLVNENSVTEPSFNATKSEEPKENSKSLFEVNVRERKTDSDQTVQVIKKAFETATREKLTQPCRLEQEDLKVKLGAQTVKVVTRKFETKQMCFTKKNVNETGKSQEKSVPNVEKTSTTDQNEQMSKENLNVSQSLSETEEKFKSDKCNPKSAAGPKINKKEMTTEKGQKFTKKAFQTKEKMNVKEKCCETERNAEEKMETNEKLNTEFVKVIAEQMSSFETEETFYVNDLESKQFTDVACFGVKSQEMIQNKQMVKENLNFTQIYRETDLKREQNSEFNKCKTTADFEDSESNVAETTGGGQKVKDETKTFIPEQTTTFSDAKGTFDLKKLEKNFERTKQKLKENSNVAMGREPEKKQIQKFESEKLNLKFAADSKINNSEIKSAEATTEKRSIPEEISIEPDSDKNQDQVLVQIRSPTSREKLCVWAVSERRRVYQTLDEHRDQTENQDSMQKQRDSSKDAQKQKVVEKPEAGVSESGLNRTRAGRLNVFTNCGNER